MYPQHDAEHSHPLFSPIRGPIWLHLIMCLASELGNELFYGTWVIVMSIAWDLHTSIPILLLWALSLGSAQYIKDKVQLPRPGCQYYNPRSPQYKQPIPNNQYIHRIETHYAAEFGCPSAHTCGAVLALYNLYCVWTNYTHLTQDPTITPFLHGSTGFLSLSTLTSIVVHFSCLFWLFLTPISRLYFGVHSILDVVGGFTISFLCMGFVIFLSWVGVIGFIAHNLIGILALIAFSITFCVLYPKHDHLWTNSSGDTALIFGSMTGSVMVSYGINLWTNYTQNHAASLFSVSGSFSFPSFFSSNLTKEIVIKTASNLSSTNPDSIQLSTSLQRCAEILVQTGCAHGGNLWTTFSSMATSAISFKQLITLCPDLFTHYAEYAPVSQLLLLNSSSAVTSALSHGQFISPSTLNPFPYGILSPPFLFPIPTLPQMSIPDILSNTDGVLVSVLLGCLLVLARAMFALIMGYLSRDLIFRKPIFRLCRVILGFPAQPPAYNQDTKVVADDKVAAAILVSSECDQDATSNRLNAHKKLAQSGSHSAVQSQCTDPAVDWSGPPKSSTLFRFTHDMPIKYINIVDMVDKFAGYVILGSLALGLFQVALDDFFGFKYFLYVP